MATLNLIQLPEAVAQTNPDGFRLYHTPEGKVYPSVTTVVGIVNEGYLSVWRENVGEAEADLIAARAGARGNRFHDFCECYLRGHPKKPGMFDQELFNPFKAILDRIDNIICLETALYSDKYRLAGRTDCVAEFDGVLSILDFKTSLNPKHSEDIESYWLQVTAYSLALEEMCGIRITKLTILIAVDGAPPHVFHSDRSLWIKRLAEVRAEFYRTRRI